MKNLVFEVRTARCNIAYFVPLSFYSACMSDFEVSFLRLVDKITNGTALKINETGLNV